MLQSFTKKKINNYEMHIFGHFPLFEDRKRVVLTFVGRFGNWKSAAFFRNLKEKCRGHKDRTSGDQSEVPPISGIYILVSSAFLFQVSEVSSRLPAADMSIKVSKTNFYLKMMANV